MSVQDPQQIKEFSYAELCERARKEAEKHKDIPEEKKRKGLEFMGLKFNVAEMHLELAIKKLITPAEDNLLKVIEMGTIGARNSRSQISSKAEFYLDDLAEKLGILKNKIYVHLKSLEKKKYIIREKTRSKGREVIGLNPVVFGQILPDQQHERERRRHLRVVDNSSDPGATEVQNQEGKDPESGYEESRIRTELDTFEDQNNHQVPEITRENLSLDSSRFNLDVFRGQNKRDKSLGGDKNKRSQQEHLQLIKEQIALAKQGKL